MKDLNSESTLKNTFLGWEEGIERDCNAVGVSEESGAVLSEVLLI